MKSSMGFPDIASQNRMVLSVLPDSISFPSGLKTVLDTESVCPLNGSFIRLPSLVSQSRSVWSALPEMMREPSKLNATLDTESE